MCSFRTETKLFPSVVPPAEKNKKKSQRSVCSVPVLFPPPPLVYLYFAHPHWTSSRLLHCFCLSHYINCSVNNMLTCPTICTSGKNTNKRTLDHFVIIFLWIFLLYGEFCCVSIFKLSISQIKTSWLKWSNKSWLRKDQSWRPERRNFVGPTLGDKCCPAFWLYTGMRTVVQLQGV